MLGTSTSADILASSISSTPPRTIIRCESHGLTYRRSYGMAPPKDEIGQPGDLYLDTTPGSCTLYIRGSTQWVCIEAPMILGESSIRHPIRRSFVLVFRPSDWPYWEFNKVLKGVKKRMDSPDIPTSSSSGKVADTGGQSSSGSLKRKIDFEDADERRTKGIRVMRGRRTPRKADATKTSNDDTPASSIPKKPGPITVTQPPPPGPYPLPVVDEAAASTDPPLGKPKYFWDVNQPGDNVGKPDDILFVLSRDKDTLPMAFVKRDRWIPIPDELRNLRMSPIWNYGRPELVLSVTRTGVDWLTPPELPPFEENGCYKVSDWLSALLVGSPFRVGADSAVQAKLVKTLNSLVEARSGQQALTAANAKWQEKCRRLEAEVRLLTQEFKRYKNQQIEGRTSVGVNTDVASTLAENEGKDKPDDPSQEGSSGTNSPTATFSNQSTQTLSVEVASMGVNTESPKLTTTGVNTDSLKTVTTGINTDCTPTKVVKGRMALKHAARPATKPVDKATPAESPLANAQTSLIDRDLRVFFHTMKETGARRCRFCRNLDPAKITDFSVSVKDDLLREHVEKDHKEFWVVYGKMPDHKVQELYGKFEKLDARG